MVQQNYSEFIQGLLIQTYCNSFTWTILESKALLPTTNKDIDN